MTDFDSDITNATGEELTKILVREIRRVRVALERQTELAERTFAPPRHISPPAPRVESSGGSGTCLDIDPKHAENACIERSGHSGKHKDDFGNEW